MQTCRFFLLTAVFVLSGGAVTFADSVGISSISIGSITSPKMPTVEAPSMGSGLYVPGRKAPSKQVSGDSAVSAGAQKNDGTSVSAVTSAKQSLAAAVDDRTLSSLSASDISALSNMGLLSQLGSLLDDTNGGRSLSVMNRNTDSTDKLLQKVLTELEEIKTSTSGESSAKVAAVPVSAASPAQTPAKSGARKSHMLRFTVNGYDVLRTCRTVYISDIQKDGAFLVTGDRRYLSDGQPRSETFHMLFKTKPNSASLTDYSAASAVSQDSFNPNSFMYQLTQRKNLSATRTGNLVSMRTTDQDWNLELLIDLGEDE